MFLIVFHFMCLGLLPASITYTIFKLQAHGSQKMAWDPLGLGLQVVLSHYVDTGGLNPDLMEEQTFLLTAEASLLPL